MVKEVGDMDGVVDGLSNRDDVEDIPIRVCVVVVRGEVTKVGPSSGAADGVDAGAHAAA